MANDRKIVHTRHVLAVKDLAVETDYYINKLGFERDFTAPGWEFLSFGEFKVMLGECSHATLARDTGDHSYFAHVMVENIDEVNAEFKANGAEFTQNIANKPWGIREFSVSTPDGHRLTYGQIIEDKH
ncbi:MAG: VOC family protein [Pyrinomonadaceae bacterium]